MTRIVRPPTMPGGISHGVRPDGTPVILEPADLPPIQIRRRWSSVPKCVFRRVFFWILHLVTR